LAQEAVYQTLVRTRREAYHQRAGQAIEALYADRLEEFYELLAYHFARSGTDGKAVEYLDLANQKATRANAMAEAKGHFDEAMQLLDRMPETSANQHRRISLLANQFLVFWMLYQLPEYVELVTRYGELAEQIDDRGLRGMLAKHIGHCQWAFGQNDLALRTISSAVEMCEAGGNILGAGMSYCLLEWVHLTLGNYDEVAAWEAKALPALEEDFDPHYYMWSRAAAALARSQRGCWQEAVAEATEALRIGVQHSDDSVTCFSAFVLCEAYTAQGNLKAALQYGELGVRTAPTPADRVWSQSFLAGAWCRAGQVEQAIEVMAGLVPAYRATRFAYGELFNGVYLGEAYWRAGRLQEAQITLDGVVELAEQTGMRFYLGSAHRLLGEVAAEADPTPEGFARAAGHFEHSITTLGAIKAETELARAYAGYGRFCRRSGSDDEARRYRTQAVEIFDRLGTLIEPRMLGDDEHH
jgi:tetratricopeptide (TPR) repeat protein